MVRDIVRDPIFLAQRAEPATAADLSLADDLLDTLAAHRDSCVGMAANMIGAAKRVIVLDNGGAVPRRSGTEQDRRKERFL